MNNYNDDIEILKESIDKYSFKKIFELYKSDKYSYYFFGKKIKIIFLIISIIISILGLLNYLNTLTILGILGISYFVYSLGEIKGYNIGVNEGLQDGFETGYINNQLEVLKILLEQKLNNFNEPEKGTLNILTIFLSNKFNGFSTSLKEEHNKDLIEFKLYEIIEREKYNYWDKGFKH